MDDLYNRVARRHRKGESGFTLIELLVVIAVIAILGAIVIFNVTGVSKAGKAAACTTDTATLQTAVDEAVSDGGTGSLPSTPTQMTAANFVTWLQTNGYIHSLPTSCQFSLNATTATQGNGASVNVYTVKGQ